MTASAAPYTWDIEIANQWQNCGAVTASLAYRCNSPKESLVSLIMPQCPSIVNWQRNHLCSHCLAHGAGNLESNWRRGQPRSRQTYNACPGRDVRVTHDGERTGRSLTLACVGPTSLECLYPRRGQLNWWYQLNPMNARALIIFAWFCIPIPILMNTPHKSTYSANNFDFCWASV